MTPIATSNHVQSSRVSELNERESDVRIAANDGAGASMQSKTGLGFSFAGARLSVVAGSGMARVVLEQDFENPHDSVLDVTYRMPLPENGAVTAYSFDIDGRTIRGEIDTKAQARDRFEKAVASGHTAALLESSRANVFTQELGNIPARKRVTVKITIEQKLSFLPEGAWEFRFPTVIGPRYFQAGSQVEKEVGTRVSAEDLRSRMMFNLRVADAVASSNALSSATHAFWSVLNKAHTVLRSKPRAALGSTAILP
jgi:Ca-activated chloride channel homolog